MIHMRKKKGVQKKYLSESLWRGMPLRRPTVYFDIKIETRNVGRIVFELRPDVVPRACGNFLELCTHAHNFGYKGSKFHRIVPGFMCQGGDFLNGNGTGNMSVFGRKFLDENFTLKHDNPGILSMANSGPNSNGSQFFITFKSTPWLDGKNVVIGKVVEGMDVLKAIENYGLINKSMDTANNANNDSTTTSEQHQRSCDVYITRCGEIVKDSQYSDIFGK